MNCAAFNCIRSGEVRLLILDKPGFFPAADVDEITTVVLCNNYVLSAGELNKLKHLNFLVSDGSNNKWANKKNAEFSRKFNLDYYDISQRGAYIVQLN